MVAQQRFISLLESRMHLIDARAVREQGVSSNPGPRVSYPLETMDSGEIVAETFEKVFEYDIGDINNFFERV